MSKPIRLYIERCATTIRRWLSSLKSPVCSIKGEVKKKHFCEGRSFSCFTAHLSEQDLFRPAAPCARLLGMVARQLRFSLPAVFIACSQRSLTVPKPTSRTMVKLATMVLLGTRGPSLFRVVREGLGSTGSLHGRSTARLANRLRLALEPECFREPDGHRLRKSRMEQAQ